MTSLGVACLLRHRGVPNGYSTASSYQVPTSSKYYSTPTSFLVGIGVAWLIPCRRVANGYSMAFSYQVPTSSKYYSMPTILFGQYWLFFAYVAYGSANAYSKGIHYKVPSSWKYYSMPTSFLVSIGISLPLRHIGVQILILRGFITKCQVVGNIIRCQRVLWWVMALLGICGILVYCLAISGQVPTSLKYLSAAYF